MDVPIEMRAWTPFVRGELLPITKDEMQQQARESGLSYADVKASHEWVQSNEVWLNSRYQVNIDRNPPVGGGWPLMWHLSIKRLDKAPVHDWRDLQRIKNELCGPEHEAVELYPAESRLVDTANSYHLFVFADPAVRLPFGWQFREVSDAPFGNAKQRPLETA